MENVNEVRKIEERYRVPVGDLQEGILQIDKDAAVTLVNREFSAVPGYLQEELIGPHFQRKDCKWIWLYGRGAFRAECRDNGRFVGILTDVSERKRNQDGIEELDQQTGYIPGVTGTGLSIVDFPFNIRYVSPSWQKICGDSSGKKCVSVYQC